MCLKNVLTLIDPMLQSAAQAVAQAVKVKGRVLFWIGEGATKMILRVGLRARTLGRIC